MSRPFLFRCPTTGLTVQGLSEKAPQAADQFVAHRCTACGGLHLVNPATGKLAADKTASNSGK